ncbi:juvenile hormone acid O-methyltransferase-like isoform X1 [Dermacentor andersoni]|uniref:juvenile hormone acid O-methyltransferase-like isoform X1 n=1 Tax=Dermacentor andersoni TaxID=34620 RepID=UPI00241680B9|nr:juvenile hormone acid O-methyltransferase-like isoform X1 [Dermacentor andersoni]
MGSVSELANNSPHSIVEVESAEIYGASMGCYRESSAQVLDAFMNAFVPIDLSDSKLSALPFLDIGCGEGNFTRRYLLPRCQHECRKLVAVDHSTAMLEYARSHHMHDMIDYVLFDIVKDDVNKFLNEHGPFARVYSFNMLHWVKDRAQAMKNIEKMIAPGGECFVIFEHCIPMFEVFIALAESPRWKQYAQVLLDKVPITARSADMGLMRSHLLHIVNETALKPLACEVLRVPVVNVPDLKDATGRRKKAMKKYRIVSYNPIYPHLNDEDKEELITFTADILAKRAQGIAEGRISNHKFTYVIHAYKSGL